MITHITKDNRAEYVKLFAKATVALQESNSEIYDAEFAITSLEEYFQNLEELYLLDPKFARIPVDEEMFEIDLNTRQINIPASFKKPGLGVQGDDLAEIIYFKVDRFFDATDLNETFIMIQWEAPNGNKMVSPAYCQEVSSETDKLIFGWAVTKEMTSMPGTLKFSVAFVDGEVVSAEGNELDITGLEYRLGTLPSSININIGLSIANQGIIKYENREQHLRNRIKNTPILGSGPDADVEFAKIIDYRGKFPWNGEMLFENIFTDLLDIPTTQEKETGIALLAVSPHAGLVSVQWFKEGVEDKLSGGPGAFAYIEVTPETVKINEAIYFVKENNSGNYRYFDERKDDWADLVARHLVFERIAFLPINEPGRYYAKITNKEGSKYSELNTLSDLNAVAVIPGPTEVSEVIVSSNVEIFSTEKPATLDAVTAFGEVADPYADLHYQWYCDDVAVEGATEKTLEATVAGDYSVGVINHWNKAVLEEVKSSNIIQLYPAAIVPEIVSFEADQLLEGTAYAVVGATLTVEFAEIAQDRAKQYVRWLYSDNDGDDAKEDWSYIMNGEEFVEGPTLVVAQPGDYKAEVFNYLTDSNVESTQTEKIQVVNIAATA